jgi:hypothetical protein
MQTPPAPHPDEPLKLTLLGFSDARARILDIAAFLDRRDRHGERGDIRHEALRQALRLLADGQPDRTRRILDLLSDPTTEPLAKSPGKGAIGVYPGLKPVNS